MPVFGTWWETAHSARIRASRTRLIRHDWKSASMRHVAHKHTGRVAECPNDLICLIISSIIVSSETVPWVVDGRGLPACKSDHPSRSEATKSAPLIAGTLEDSRLRVGQDIRLRDETYLSCGHSVVSGARGATGPGLQQCCGHLECGLHYLRDVQSQALVSGHLGSESTGSHLRVGEMNWGK